MDTALHELLRRFDAGAGFEQMIDDISVLDIDADRQRRLYLTLLKGLVHARSPEGELVLALGCFSTASDMAEKPSLRILADYYQAIAMLMHLMPPRMTIAFRRRRRLLGTGIIANLQQVAVDAETHLLMKTALSLQVGLALSVMAELHALFGMPPDIAEWRAQLEYSDTLLAPHIEHDTRAQERIAVNRTLAEHPDDIDDTDFSTLLYGVGELLATLS